MSFDRFRSQVWSAVLLDALRKALVYGQPAVVNTDYEGDISQAGDTVKITSISDPTVGTYTPGTDITVEELTDAQRNLVIDQSKYFAFVVDDVDKRQAAGNIMTEAMSRAAYKLKDTADTFIAGLYTDAATANTISSTALPTATPEDAYDKILVPLGVLLDEADVPSDGRYCIVPPWVHGRLLRDDRFVKADHAADNGQALRNGMIGRASGFDIMKSNNTPQPSAGSSWIVQAGHPMAISYATQINKVVAYSPEKRFGDAVKGLNLYGAKVVRPNAIAVATVTKS